MALTQEDLQAIAALMDAKLEPIKTEQAATNARLDTIQEDIDEIKKVAAKVDHDVIPKLSELYDGYQRTTTSWTIFNPALTKWPRP